MNIVVGRLSRSGPLMQFVEVGLESEATGHSCAAGAAGRANSSGYAPCWGAALPFLWIDRQLIDLFADHGHADLPLQVPG